MPEFKDLWVYTENDRGLRILLAIIFALIIVFAIWLWFKAFIIKPKSMAQFNVPSVTSNDTSVVNKPSIEKTLIIKEDAKPKTTEKKKDEVSGAEKMGENDAPKEISQGAKNAFNGGTGNTYNDVHVGDKYNEPKVLSEVDLQSLLDYIESEKVKRGSNEKCFSIQFALFSNGQKIENQVISFMTNNGYSYKGTVYAALKQFRDIEILFQDDCVKIRLGYFE